jgi:hypothetical protein
MLLLLRALPVKLRLEPFCNLPTQGLFDKLAGCAAAWALKAPGFDPG